MDECPELPPAVHAFVFPPPSTDASLPEEKGSAFLMIASLVPARVSLKSLIVGLQPQLANPEGPEQRHRATLLLALLIERWAAANEWKDATGQRPNGLESMIEFFGSRLVDFYSVIPSLRALRGLLRVAERSPHVALHPARTASRAVHNNLDLPSVRNMRWQERSVVYKFFLDVLSSQTHATSLLTRDASIPDDTSLVLNLAVDFVVVMTKEKDPRCLLDCLAVIERLLSTAPPLCIGDVVASVTEKLFESASRYFPIVFTPPPNDVYGITRAKLVSALRRVFVASPRLVAYVVPLLLSKMSSLNPSTKLDATQTLCFVASSQGVHTLAPYLRELSIELVREVLDADNATDESAVYHSAGMAASVAPAAPASLWMPQGSASASAATGGRGDSRYMIGATAGAIGVDFSGDPSTHSRSGYGLYVRDKIAPVSQDEGDSDSSSRGPPTTGDAARVFNAAVSAIAQTTRMLSDALGSTVTEQEWHAFVTPILETASLNVVNKPSSRMGRTSALILCAIASVSHRALATVLRSVIPSMISGRLEYVGLPAGFSASDSAAVLSVIAGLLHTVNPHIDHPPGGHPLAPYATRLYDMLLDALMLVDVPPVAMILTDSLAVNGDNSEARCIAAAALCDLLVRPPSLLFPTTVVHTLTEQLTALLMRDANEAVRMACLRCLCTMASVRPFMCAVVVEISVSRLIAVVREYFRAPLHHSTEASASTNTYGALRRVDSSLSTTSSGSYAAGSSDWMQLSRVTLGLPDPLGAALHALSQLVSTTAPCMQRIVIPQLLQLAIVEEPAIGGERGLVRIRVGARPDGNSDGGAAAGATIETICRLCAFKATVSDDVAMSAFVEHSPESLSTWTAMRMRIRSMRGSGATSGNYSTKDGDEDVDGVSMRSDDTPSVPADVDVLSPPSANSSPGLLSDPLSREVPLLVIPTLFDLVVDSARTQVADLTTNVDSARALALPLRVRAAVELAFRTVAVATPHRVQSRFRLDVARALLRDADQRAASGDDEGARIDVLVAGGSAASSLSVLSPAPWYTPLSPRANTEQLRLLPIMLNVLCCSAPDSPLSFTGLRSQVLALTAAVFEMPCGQLPIAEDPRQRERRRAIVATRLDHTSSHGVGGGGPLDLDLVYDDPDATATQAVADATQRLATDLRRSAVLSAQTVAMAFNRMPPLGEQWAAPDVRHAASAYVAKALSDVLAAVVAGSGIGSRALVSSVTRSPAVRSPQLPAKRDYATYAPADGPPVLAIRSPVVAAPPELDEALPSQAAPALWARAQVAGGVSAYITTARERGVLMLIWLAKGLAMRPGGTLSARRCIHALVNVICAQDIALVDVAPVSSHLRTLAAYGLGLIVADAPARHPFSRNAGALIASIFKQRTFQLVFELYKERFDRNDNSDDVGKTPNSPERSSDELSPEVIGKSSPRTPGGFSSASSSATRVQAGANAEEAAPFLMAMCCMFSNFPATVASTEVPRVLPFAIRLLELAAVGSVQAGGTVGAATVNASHEATGDAGIPSLSDVVSIAALHCVQMLVRHGPDAVATHLLTLVPLLLRLSVYSRWHQTRPAVRAVAIDCIRGLVGLPYHQLYAVRSTVISGLVPALDDPRRAIRRRAAACRNEWATLSGGKRSA